jgi:hypothetical protein
MKARNPLFLLVAKGGIEPPTQGFSVTSPVYLCVFMRIYKNTQTFTQSSFQGIFGIYAH